MGAAASSASTEQTPLKSKEEKGGAGPSSVKQYSTVFHAFANELKCLVGIGSLTLPYVTAQLGLVLSLVGVLVLCYFALEGIRLLVYCAAHEGRRVRHGADLLGGNGEGGQDGGSGSWRRVSIAAFGDWGWYVTLTALLCAQLGTATSYINQTRDAVQDLAGDLSSGACLAIVWLSLSLLVQFITPGMRTVAWFSLVALCVYVYIYALVLVYFTQHPYDFTPADPIRLARPEWINVWYGCALFSFEGMGTALSVYESLGTHDPRPFLTIASISYLIAGLVYCFVMTFGYLCYGNDVAKVIVNDFSHGAEGTFARYVLGIALSCSYVLQMTPVFQTCEAAIVGTAIEQATPARMRPNLWMGVRVLLVTCTVAASSVISDVQRMVAITGSLFFSLLCFVLPGLFFLKLAPNCPCPLYQRGLAAVLVPLGLVGAVIGMHGAIITEGAW